ncbi:MAG TPA: hypothetical protein VG269_18125 [Tepidisphaeraceae bacterium]|jgi:DnaJ-class molecular chaperone|nr:hypothetical protein [Tepidisphaeraceae bacterium]
MNEPSNMAVELESACERCHGDGGWGGEEECRAWHWCGKCGGAGYEPTEFGRKVLSLMRHHFKPMLETASAKD